MYLDLIFCGVTSDSFEGIFFPGPTILNQIDRTKTPENGCVILGLNEDTLGGESSINVVERF